MIRRGDYVETPRGRGRVVYVRMAAPDYALVAAVSVDLDAGRAGRPDYVGMIFPVADVRLITE